MGGAGGQGSGGMNWAPGMPQPQGALLAPNYQMQASYNSYLLVGWFVLRPDNIITQLFVQNSMFLPKSILNLIKIFNGDIVSSYFIY